eukprot:m.468704 g.468704  ORF g.468704 m.468704 type:complete len:310 (-) comp57080_c0_seq1:202-1131(-)
MDMAHPLTSAALEIQSADIARFYDIAWKKPLGSGVHGTVVEAVRRADGQAFALKVLADSPSARQEVAMQWECRSNDHVVHIEAVFLNLHRPAKSFSVMPCLFVVMEQCRAAENHGDMFELVAHIGGLPEELAKAAIYDIAVAIKSLHDRDIAHCDIKLENMLISRFADDQLGVRLADFGFAKRFPLTEADLARSPSYTTDYIAPEILRSLKQYKRSGTSLAYTAKCDMWALGVSAYIMLCGLPPFPNGDLRVQKTFAILNAELPFDEAKWLTVSADAKRIVRALLTVDVDRRLSVDDLLKDPWFDSLLQ